jgi:hypothetical protein
VASAASVHPRQFRRAHLGLHLLQLRHRRLGAARALVEVLVQRGPGLDHVGPGRVVLSRQQRQPRIEQFQFEVLAQEEALLRRHQHGLRVFDAADPHQRACFGGDGVAPAFPPQCGGRRGRPAGQVVDRRARRRIRQRQIVDLPHQFIEPRQHAGHVGHGSGADARHVTHHRRMQPRQSRLAGPRQPLLRAAQGGQQRLGAAGQLGLLLRQPQGRFDVHHQVLVARARQALHQLLDLRALHGDLGQARLQHGLAGRGVARDVLGLARQRPRLHGGGAAVSALARQLLLDGAELLPQHGAPQQRTAGQRHQQQQRGARHRHRAGRIGQRAQRHR